MKKTRPAYVLALTLILAGCSTARVESLPIISDERSSKDFHQVAGCLALALGNNRSYPIETVQRPDGVTISQSMPVSAFTSVAAVIDIEKISDGSRVTMRAVGVKTTRPFPPNLAACL